MKSRLLFIICLLFFIQSYGQLSDWLIHIDSSENVTDIAIDDFGDFYITGITGFNASYKSVKGISINGNSYTSPHLSYRGYNTGYLAKVDSNGNMLWCKMMETGYPFEMSILGSTVDNNNDVIFTVEFVDTLQIENDTLITIGPSSAPNIRADHALVKYDRAGNFLWASVIPGKAAWNRVYELNNYNLESDQNNNIYINWDTANISQFLDTGFIHKFNSSGHLIQSFQKLAFGEGFTLDKNGNVFVPWSSVFEISDTLFLQYSPAGSIIYSLTVNDEAIITHLEVDTNDNLYAIGLFNSSSLTIGGHTISGASGEEGFIFKMNSSKHIEWLKPIKDCNSSIGSFIYLGGLEIDQHGEILLTGSFYNEMCHGSDHYLSQNSRDSLSIFMFKLDKHGNLLWSKYSRGEGYHYSTNLVKGGENIYLALNGWSGAFQQSDTLFFDTLWSRGFGGFVYKIKDGSNLISGRVFVDSNSSGTPSPGDRYFKNQIISINATDHTITQENGLYEAYVPKGNYALSYPNPVRYHTSAPLSHSATFSSFNQFDDDNHFILNQASGVNDVRVNLVAGFAILRGWSARWYSKAYLDLYISNDGSGTHSDSCFLQYDSRIILDTATLMPDLHTNGKMAWAYKNLKPYERRTIRIKFDISNLNVGDSLMYHARVEPLAGDSLKTNNIDSTRQIVWAAYDPNDKLVEPVGDVKPEFVQNGNYFYYTVRFQNTGNYFAEYVRIRDTISSDLDLESFEMIGASHDYRIELINPNVMDFIFEDIHLPDSGRDFEGSMGYVNYRIKADPTLTHGDFIDNTAHIYFDNNEAVVTNTAHTEISDWAGVEEALGREEGIFIFPNPTESSFRILLNALPSDKVNVSIRDLSGRLVYTQPDMRPINQEIEVSNLNLNAGMYVVAVVQKGQRYTTKLVVE